MYLLRSSCGTSDLSSYSSSLEPLPVMTAIGGGWGRGCGGGEEGESGSGRGKGGQTSQLLGMEQASVHLVSRTPRAAGDLRRKYTLLIIRKEETNILWGAGSSRLLHCLTFPSSRLCQCDEIDIFFAPASVFHRSLFLAPLPACCFCTESRMRRASVYWTAVTMVTQLL